eukprot:c20787_g14_i1.p1 GENE.c20787_g14_i1~~c20787_g14_i1.p1  ORF type:complete len:589 (+),score=124.15 c20787_g14_i1:45-1811(+)
MVKFGQRISDHQKSKPEWAGGCIDYESLKNIRAQEKAKEITDMEEHAYLNYEGFRKILKKHDKMLEVKMLDSFMLDLDHNEISFWKKSKKLRRCVDLVSALYQRGGKYETLNVVSVEPNAGDADFSEGGVKKSFIRKNYKYWVPRYRLLDLLTRLSEHLPLYYFTQQSEDTATPDPMTTSVYLDNERLEIFANRIRREDGAILIRYRVYGDTRPSRDGTAFVERKTHYEKSYGGQSKKERFQIAEPDVDASMGAQIVELQNPGKSDALLQNEIAETIRSLNLRPVVTTRYRRTVFQMSSDDRLRISIDSSLSFTKEHHITDWNWYQHLGRIPAPDEIYEFPYAVLELKVRDIEVPAWFTALVADNLVIEVPKFSKFVHGVCSFRGSHVPEIPYWIEERRSEFEFLFSEDTPPQPPTSKMAHLRLDSDDLSSTPIALAQVKQRGFLAKLFPNKYDKMVDNDGVIVRQKTGGGRPQKSDPKSFMANERTFLNWNQQAITLCTFGVALVSLGEDNSAFVAGLMMVIVGIMVLLYGQYQYYRRWTMLRDKANGLLFLDARGPLFLTACLVATFTLAILFHASPPSTGANVIN